MSGIVLKESVEILITKISICLNQVNDSLFETGKYLLELKDQTKHGEFLLAIERVGLKKSTANRLINTTKMLMGKFPNLGNMKPSILYELAEPSTPDEVRNHVDNGVANGAQYTLKDIQRLKAEAKSEAKQEIQANIETTIQQRSEEWRQQYLQERNKARESETKIYQLESKVKTMEEAEPKVVEVVPKAFASVEQAIDYEKSKLNDVKRELKKARKEYRDSCNNLARLQGDCAVLAKKKESQQDKISKAKLARKQFEGAIAVFASQMNLADVELIFSTVEGLNTPYIDGLLKQLDFVSNRLKELRNTVCVENEGNVYQIVRGN